MEDPAVWCYNLTVMKNQNTEVYYTPIQMKFPLGFEKIIKIDDPVYTFSEVMAHIDLQKYFVEKGHEMGRPRYDREKLLKIVLFAFMEFGYCSVRFIQKLCETDVRFLWMLDGEEAPCHMTIDNFISNAKTCKISRSKFECFCRTRSKRTVFPENSRAAFGSDDRIVGIFQQQYLSVHAVYIFCFD